MMPLFIYTLSLFWFWTRPTLSCDTPVTFYLDFPIRSRHVVLSSLP
jgi:hypothetical protein